MRQCADILADVFGPDFATAMIGKTVEVEGLVTHCNTGTGILIKLQHQIKLVGTGPGMVPAVTPPPYKFPEDPNLHFVLEAAPAAPQPPPRQYDLFAPNYDINAEASIQTFCNRRYNPGVFREPFISAQKDRAQEIAAEVAACKTKFNAEELRKNRQATMFYCLTHFDPRNAPLEKYDTCFRQNDALLAMCAHQLQNRDQINGLPPGSTLVRECPVPHSNRAEVARVKTGGNVNGPELPVRSQGPGIPPNLFAGLAPGIVRSAGPLEQVQSAPTAAPSSTPAAPAKPVSTPAKSGAQPTPQQTQQQRQQEVMATVQRRQACVDKARKDYPQGGPALNNAIVACVSK